ncbi:MAG: GLPGLI family protein [Chitinophagaceae bacterium]|nr:MAG: GLPGLI family protein [Chitinophagaceae bacterium]
MKYLISSILFSLLGLCSHSQNGYRITFVNKTTLKPTDGRATIESKYLRQIITDTAVYLYPSNKKNNSNLVYGKLIHHYSIYYFSKSNTYYYGNDDNVFSGPFLLKKTPPHDTTRWIADTTIISTFNGYRCARALGIKGPGDSSKVIYTPDIQYPPGFNGYQGLPGVVLEIYNNKSNIHLQAISIEKDAFEITLPKQQMIKEQ